ncbi:Sigma-70 family RNA polymerase sigma factor, partial [Dysosmobacter welbionis]
GDAAHVGNLRQRLLCGGHQRVHGAEVGGEGLGGLLPHLPDAQAVQQAAQVVGLGVLNGPDQVLRGLLPHPVQLGHVRGVEAVQVRGVGDQPGVDQLLDHRRTAAVDVHGVPAGEVGEVPQQLGRALRAGAAQGRAVLVPDHWGAAHRAGVRQRVGHRALRAFVEVH